MAKKRRKGRKAGRKGRGRKVSRRGRGRKLPKNLRGVKVRARFGAAGSKFGCYAKRVRARGNKTRLAAYCSKKLGGA